MHCILGCAPPSAAFFLVKSRSCCCNWKELASEGGLFAQQEELIAYEKDINVWSSTLLEWQRLGTSAVFCSKEVLIEYGFLEWCWSHIDRFFVVFFRQVREHQQDNPEFIDMMLQRWFAQKGSGSGGFSEQVLKKSLRVHVRQDSVSATWQKGATSRRNSGSCSVWDSDFPKLHGFLVTGRAVRGARAKKKNMRRCTQWVFGMNLVGFVWFLVISHITFISCFQFLFSEFLGEQWNGSMSWKPQQLPNRMSYIVTQLPMGPTAEAWCRVSLRNRCGLPCLSRRKSTLCGTDGNHPMGWWTWKFTMLSVKFDFFTEYLRIFLIFRQNLSESHYPCHFHSSWLTYWFERRGCSHARLFKQCCQCKVNRCRVNRISVTFHVMVCLQIAVPNAQEQGQGPSLHCQGWAVETQICLNLWHCNWLHEWIKVKRDEMKSDSIHFNTFQYYS